MTLPSKHYGCWRTGPLRVPWPDSRPDCGYPPEEMVLDERCRGCYEHPDRKQMDARAAESQAIEAKINILQDLWWARWEDGRTWSPEAKLLLNQERPMKDNQNGSDVLIPNVVVDIRLSLPVGDIDETGFNNKLVGMLHRMADHFELTQPDKDHGIVSMGDAGFTSWDAHWERWDDDVQTAQRTGKLPVDLSAYPNGDPTVNHTFDALVTGEEEEQDRALSRLRRDRRHWENCQEGHKSDDDKPVPVSDPDFVVTPPSSTPRDDDKARYLKGSVADAWKDINKISRLFYVKRKPVHPVKHPIDSAPPPKTPGELPPGLNLPVVYPDTGGFEGPGVLSVDHTGIAEVIAPLTVQMIEGWMTQIRAAQEVYLIERGRNPYDWDMMERTQEFMFIMLDTCNTPVELDIFNILERQSFKNMCKSTDKNEQKKAIYPSAVSKMMRHAAPLDLFRFLPGGKPNG